MFKDTKSHRIVSLQFLSALNIFFGGDVKLSKEPITELYKNLSLETPSGQQRIEFEKISDLTANISFKVKHCILSKLEKQDKRNAGNNKTHKFLKKLSEEKEF